MPSAIDGSQLSTPNVLKDRKYKSGTGWCVWRWTDVQTEDIVRLHIVKTPLGALCVHWLKTPDPEPWQHDHPVSFFSIILSGWYREERGADIRTRWYFNFIRATDTHRIIEVAPNTVTLCFMGPKTREWGLHTDHGWVWWKSYYDALRAPRAPGWLPQSIYDAIGAKKLCKPCLVDETGVPFTFTDGKSVDDCKAKFDNVYRFSPDELTRLKERRA